MKKAAGVAAAVACGVAIALGGVVPANAESRSSTWTCPSAMWAQTAVQSTASVTHYVESSGRWQSVTKPAGYSAVRSPFRGTGVYATVTSSGKITWATWGCVAA